MDYKNPIDFALKRKIVKKSFSFKKEKEKRCIEISMPG